MIDDIIQHLTFGYNQSYSIRRWKVQVNNKKKTIQRILNGLEIRRNLPLYYGNLNYLKGSESIFMHN